MKRALYIVKRFVTWGCIVSAIALLTGCGASVEKTRENVIQEWSSSADKTMATQSIQSAYELYPEDETIRNLYYYSQAKKAYENYEAEDIVTNYDKAQSLYIEVLQYTREIDPNYSGELSDEIQSFLIQVNSPHQNDSKTQESAKANENITNTDIPEANQQNSERSYQTIPNSEKKQICTFIKSRYKYFDEIEGGYSGDKYSDTIMKEAADIYKLSEEDIKIIWMYATKY